MYRCDYCGAKISDGSYQAIVLRLADTEEEEVFCFCSRMCRRAFERRLQKAMAMVGFDLELNKVNAGGQKVHRR